MVSSAARTKVRTDIIWYLVAGVSGGLLAGFLGIGGGIILVPIMAGVLGLTQHKAHGTSLAIIIPTATAGTIIYALREHIDWTLAISIGAGSIIGAIIGARMMIKIPSHRLRQIFGLYTIIVGILLLIPDIRL